MARAARAKGILALLVCVHCSLTFFAALAGLALAGVTAPTLLGVRADMLFLPLTGASLFAGWLWWGRRSALRACETPGAPKGMPEATLPGK